MPWTISVSAAAGTFQGSPSRDTQTASSTGHTPKTRELPLGDSSSQTRSSSRDGCFGQLRTRGIRARNPAGTPVVDASPIRAPLAPCSLTSSEWQAAALNATTRSTAAFTGNLISDVQAGQRTDPGPALELTDAPRDPLIPKRKMLFRETGSSGRWKKITVQRLIGVYVCVTPQSIVIIHKRVTNRVRVSSNKICLVATTRTT